MKWLLKLDKFVPLLLLMIIIARYFPEPAIREATINLHLIGDIGITLIFFFYGLKLNLRKLKQDLSNWKLHIVTQVSTFIIFPLLVLPFINVLGKDSPYELIWLGFFFMAALPSTVSSAVVMISIAKGNVPGGIFNASISSLIGIIITPLWMGIVISSGSTEFQDFGSIIVKLVIQVLIPVIAGIMLNRFWGQLYRSNIQYLKYFDQAVILLIVYLSFAESFAKNLFSSTGLKELLMIIAGCLLLFIIIFLIILYVSRLLKFEKPDTITALFAGSKKSLVHGTVMSDIIFTGFTGVGLILLPLMIYHTLQLIITGIMAKKMAG